MSLEAIPNRGLKAPGTIYSRLKAFHGGGFYWDSEAQQLIRSALGDYLPALEQENENGRSSGLFHSEQRGREVLSRSRPVGQRFRIPAQQWEQLQQQVAAFQRKANLPEVTVNNREVIRHFKLPDFARNPELYRLAGPFWNRRCYVLWGCERTTESSLAPEVALAKLPVDRHYDWKKWLALAAAVLVLLALLGFGLPWVWHWMRSAANRKPAARMALTAVNETNSRPASPPLSPKDSPPPAPAPLALAASTSSGQPLPPSARPQPGSGAADQPSSPSAPAVPSASSAEPAAAAPSGGPMAPRPGTAGNEAPSQMQRPAPAGNPITATPPSPPATSPEPREPKPGIVTVSEHVLSDQVMEVTFAVRHPANPGVSLPVYYWEVDGIRTPVTGEFSTQLTRGRHTVVVRPVKHTGMPVTITNDLTVEVWGRASLSDPAAASR